MAAATGSADVATPVAALLPTTATSPKVEAVATPAARIRDAAAGWRFRRFLAGGRGVAAAGGVAVPTDGTGSVTGSASVVIVGTVLVILGLVVAVVLTVAVAVVVLVPVVAVVVVPVVVVGVGVHRT